MANDNTLNVEIKAIITDLERNLKKATKGLEKFSAKSAAIGKKMKSTGVAMSKSFTAPLAILGGVALKAAADLETLETSLSVMTGSAEKGKELLKDLTDFAAKTPFQLEGIGNTAKMLLAFGFTAVEVKENLQSLGDVSAGSGTDLGELGRVFGQVAAAGKLTGERLLQFQERAVPIGPALAKTMGVAESSIKEMVSAGKVSFADFEKAFKSLAQEGGIFEDAMIKQSKTLAGIFSTLKDNVQLSLGALGQDIATTFDLRGVAEKLIEKIQSITKWFANLDKGTKKTIIQIAGLAAVIGPLLVTLGFMTTTVIPLLVTGFGLLSGAIVTATLNTALFTTALLANPITPFALALGVLVDVFLDYVKEITPLVSKTKTFINLMKSLGSHAKFVELQMRDQMEAMDDLSRTEAYNRMISDQKLAIQNEERLNKLLGKKPKGKGKGKGVDIMRPMVESIKTSIPVMNAGVKGYLGNLSERLVGGMGVLKSTILPIVTETAGILTKVIPNGETLDPQLEAWKQHIESLKVSLLEFKQAASDIVVNGIGNTFSLLGSSIGEALAEGTNVLKAAGGALLQGLGSILVQLGEMAIAAGIANLALFAALSGPPNPVSAAAAIAAGVALIAVGSAVSSLNKSVASGGTGGGSTGGGGASDNSSFSGGSTSGFSGGSGAGGTYVFEIAGTKLVGVLKNTLDRNRALGGSLGFTS